MVKKVVSIFVILMGIWFLAWNLFMPLSQKNQIYEYVNTEFSSNFTTEKWESVSNGQSKEDVIRLLGQPVYSNVLQPKVDNDYLILDFSGPLKEKHFFSGYACCIHSVVFDSTMLVVRKCKSWDED